MQFKNNFFHSNPSIGWRKQLLPFLCNAIFSNDWLKPLLCLVTECEKNIYSSNWLELDLSAQTLSTKTKTKKKQVMFDYIL